jgi:nucleoside phosphorylase
MINVLIVEDNEDKRDRIVNCLISTKLVGGQDISAVSTLVSAKRLLKDIQFDLLVLDISVPDSEESEPKRLGGLELLVELREREVFLLPRHVVGLTGYEEIIIEHADDFANEVLSVIQYRTDSEEWERKLERKLRHICRAEKGAYSGPQYATCLGVVTALHTPELAAILELPWSWSQTDFTGDGTVYHRGIFVHEGVTHEVVAAAAPRMGMVASAILASKMIAEFRPELLCMCGILAGVSKDCNMGDVVAGDPVWDYQSGKVRSTGATSEFEASPHQLGLDARIRSQIQLLAQDHQSLDSIHRSWRGPKPSTALRLHVGPVASGASVVADASVVSQIKAQHRKLLGIEMESYGVFAAADGSSLPKPKVFALKAVCDFADERKADDFQSYAAFTSAEVLRVLMENYRP